jgi:hypothetical protein
MNRSEPCEKLRRVCLLSALPERFTACAGWARGVERFAPSVDGRRLRAGQSLSSKETPASLRALASPFA